MSTRSIFDQYYFKEEYGKKYIKQIIKENPTAQLFLEPAAGKGALSTPLIEAGKWCIATDIEPAADNITKCNFFEFPWEKHNIPTKDKVVTVLSPPYGKHNYLVYKFFNGCAERSNTIYLICSRVFKKSHSHKELNKHFHLEYNRDLPRDSFTVNGNTHKLRCCFQKWVWKKEERIIKLRYKSKYFEFTERDQQYDFAIGRVNISAGKVLHNPFVYKDGKNIFHIKLNSKYKHILKYIKENINLKEVANNTVIAKSVTRYEVVAEIEKVIKGYNKF